MLFGLCLAAFVAFPEREDALLAKESKDNVVIEKSGSLGLFHYDDNRCFLTYGNETLSSERKEDWCSNIAKPGEKPFIQYSIRGKKVKLTKYSVRNGCCDYACCCTTEGEKIDKYCCCYLYSYSLQASNDRRTWITIHSVEKDKDFYPCKAKTFDVNTKGQAFTYFRFVMDEEYPNCERCVQLNQIEFYGSAFNLDNNDADDEIEDDETISIIGRVSKHD